MDYVVRKREAIIEWLEGLDDNSLVGVWNQKCQNSNCCDDEIFSNEEDFFTTYFSKTMEAVRAVCFGDYTFQDDWVHFNGLGNLETTNNPSDWMDMGEIADEILESEGDFDCWVELEDEEEEVTQVVIEESEDGTCAIYNEAGQCIECDFADYSDAYDWVEDDDSLELVDSFNV